MNNREKLMCNKSETIDRKLSFTIIFFFIIQSANSTIKTNFPELGDGVNSALSALSGIIILFLLLKSMKIVVKSHFNLVARSYVLFTTIYLLSFVQISLRGAPVGVMLKESMLWTMVWWLPLGLIAYSVNDKKILYQTLTKWSYLLSVVTLLSLYGYYINLIELSVTQSGKSNYNMFFSYMLVLTMVLHLNEVIDSKKKLAAFFCVIELAAIIIYGSRGAFLCIAAYFVLKFLMGGLKTRSKVKLSIAVGMMAAIFFIGINALNKDIEDVGLTSRTLEMFTEGRASESDGRDKLRKYAIELIEERPFLGYGLGGEFSEMYEKNYGSISRGEEFSSLTPHNGFLQLMLNFGIVIGLLVGSIIALSLLVIPHVKNIQTRELFIIFFSLYIVPALTVGDGIFTKPGIALYLFMVLRWHHDVKQKRMLSQFKNEHSKFETKAS